MAPCPPIVYVDEDLWSNVKRDSSNIIVLQASAVRAAWSAAFGSGSGDCSHRIVVMGDDGIPMAVIAEAETLAEGEKDWEWAVTAFKTEFRRKIPPQHKIIEHFVTLWNKTHRSMAIAHPVWKKDSGCCCDMREIRDLMQTADSEANILDTANYRVEHILDFTDLQGYPQGYTSHPIRSTTSSLFHRGTAQNTPTEHENKHKLYEAALNAYRLPFRQPHHLPGYDHSAGDDVLNFSFCTPVAPSGSRRAGGAARPVTTLFSPTTPKKRSGKRKSFNGKLL